MFELESQMRSAERIFGGADRFSSGKETVPDAKKPRRSQDGVRLD